MSRGLAVPCGVDRRGQALTVTGTAATEQAIRLALSPGDSDNPFQDEGFPEDLVFRDPAKAKAVISSRLGILFEQLSDEKRASLISYEFREDEDGGLLETEIEYLDLEAGEPTKRNMTHRS